MAEALYRKYRPQVFSEVVGQDHIERTLKNALEQDKLSHAYLFCGPRGTGKTTTARLLAKALLCEQGPTANPDGTCASCQEIARGEHPDVYELDAASRTGVENVREEIISRVQFSPTRGAYKVYIIDEVHMLSTAAFNALLKTLEEPPNHVVFVLCTTDPQKVPATILSRCQRFDFRRIDVQGMTDRLEQICQAEGVTFEREALEIIANTADGGLRNALTALEQAIAFGEGCVSLACVQQLGATQTACDVAPLVASLAKRDIASAFLWVEPFAQAGGSFARLTADVAQRVRDMYFLSVAGEQAPLSVVPEMRPQLIEQTQQFSSDRLAYMLDVLGTTLQQLKQASNARLCFEIALTKICRPESDLTLESLAQRVEALEKNPVSNVHEAYETHGVHETSETCETRAATEARATTQCINTAASATTTTADNPKAESLPPTEMLTKGGDICHAAKLEGLANPAMVQRIWQRAFAEIKRDRPAYTSLLMSAHASYNQDSNSFDIAFRQGYAFALGMLQKPEVLDYLQQVISQAAGTTVSVAVFVEGNQNTSIEAKQSAPTPTEQSHAEEASQPLPQSISTSSVFAEQPATEQAPTNQPATEQPATTNIPQTSTGEASQPSPHSATTPSQAQATQEPQENDPFALPEIDDTIIELDEFQQMLAQSFGENVPVTEE